MLKFIRFHSRWFIALGVLAVVAVVAFRPVMSRVKVWRSAQLVEDAQEFRELGESGEALRAALAAVQLDPGSFPALREYFYAQVQSRDPGVLRTAAVVAVHGESSADDRARALGVFLDVRDLVSVPPLLGAMGDESHAQPAVRFQIVRFLLMAGRPADAVRAADELPAGSRGERFDLLLGRHLVSDPRDEVRAEGFRRLGDLLGGGDRDAALDAMRVLASQPDRGITRELARRALERFGDDPALSPTDRFAVYLFELGLGEAGREMLVEEVIARHRDGELTQLLSWLLRVGEAAKVVELSGAQARGGAGWSLDVFRVRARALRALGRYGELMAELESPPAGIPDVELHAARAAVARLLEDDVREAEGWRRAFSAAAMRRARNDFPVIARTAARVGAREQQMEALARSIEHPIGIPPLASEVTELFAWLAERDTERLLRVSRRLLAREPGNPALVNNYHYLMTLHGRADSNTVDALAALVDAFPDRVEFRGSLAFAQLRTGDAAAALATLRESGVAHDALPAAEQAVRAAALRACGDAGAAARAAAEVDWAELAPDESAILRQLAAGESS